MKNQVIRTLDPQGRIVLPRALTSQVGWAAGSNLTTFVNLRNKTVELFIQEGGAMQIDELGRVTIPNGLRDALGWAASSKLAVEINAFEGSILLELEEKLAPKCVFCGKEEEAITINDVSICRQHMLTIASWAKLDKLRDA